MVIVITGILAATKTHRMAHRSSPNGCRPAHSRGYAEAGFTAVVQEVILGGTSSWPTRG